MRNPLGNPSLALAGICLAGVLGVGLGALRAAQPHDGAGGPAPLLVTSSLGANSAVLFVLDAQYRRLAAYEALPGEEGGLRLLGARRIEHDLLLARYRDLSEVTPQELEEHYGNDPDGSAESDR